MNTCSPDTISVVLFYCNQRTGHFGQGAFTNALLPLFKENKEIYKLIIIRTDSYYSKEMAVRHDEGTETIDLPTYPGAQRLTGENIPSQKQYACYLAGKLYPYLVNRQNLLLWANSVDYLNLAIELKELFPSAKVLYVHHSFSWKYLMNVDDAVFSREWKNDNSDFHPLAFEMTACLPVKASPGFYLLISSVYLLGS